MRFGPGSPGEAISRFRDDASKGAAFLAQLPFLSAFALFAAAAAVVMVRTS